MEWNALCLFLLESLMYVVRRVSDEFSQVIKVKQK
jgi:hypothetical protein